MSVKIYTNFLLSSGVYNFKTNSLKNKNKTWNVSSYLAEQFGIIPIATRALFLAQGVKMLRKSRKILS